MSPSLYSATDNLSPSLSATDNHSGTEGERLALLLLHLLFPLSQLMLMPTAHVSHLLLRRRRLRQLTDVHCGSSSITSSSITRHCSSSEPAASSYAKFSSGRWNSDILMSSLQTYYLFFNLPYTPPILYFRILRNSSYFFSFLFFLFHSTILL